jgi:hypothetical protein
MFSVLFNSSFLLLPSQTAFYFLYMANVAFAFFLMMGSIGFYSAFAFVRYIYRCDWCSVPILFVQVVDVTRWHVFCSCALSWSVRSRRIK